MELAKGKIRIEVRMAARISAARFWLRVAGSRLYL